MNYIRSPSNPKSIYKCLLIPRKLLRMLLFALPHPAPGFVFAIKPSCLSIALLDSYVDLLWRAPSLPPVPS